MQIHANVAQSGTAQDWKSCFLRDIPVQIRALALFFLYSAVAKNGSDFKVRTYNKKEAPAPKVKNFYKSGKLWP